MKQFFFSRNTTVALISILIAISIALSCKKIQQLLTFTISNEANITVKSNSPLNLPFSISTPNVTTNSNQEFQNNNTNANLVKDIRLSSLKLTISSPSGQTFAFLKSIHIYISTNSSNEIELASLATPPGNVTSIDLTPTQARLDEYIKASSFNLRTAVETNQTITKDIELKANSKFKVTANL